MYGAEVSRTTISTITGKVLEGMYEWGDRPLDPVYPAVFIDAIHVKVWEGRVADRPSYVALAVTSGGNRDIGGLLVNIHLGVAAELPILVDDEHDALEVGLGGALLLDAAVVAGPKPEETGEIPSSCWSPRRSPWIVSPPVNPLTSDVTWPSAPPHVVFSRVCVSCTRMSL